MLPFQYFFHRNLNSDFYPLILFGARQEKKKKKTTGIQAISMKTFCLSISGE